MGALERAQVLLQRADPDHTLPACKIRVIDIGPESLEKVGQLAQELLPAGSEVGFIIDRTPIFKGGRSAKENVLTQLSQHFSVRVIELDDGYPELHASEEVINRSIEAARGLTALVSLGGGTITDIGKMTAIGIGDKTHIAIQTAASVDGYTDDVSVILKKGVKRTVPSRWPDAVVADTTLISQAPALMNTAGFGEIYSMFTAPADWRLAALLGFEKKFHWGPIELLRGVGEGIEEWSVGLADSKIASVERLVEALAVRGITTGVAGTTACLSGIEHLISHMLDMHQGARGEPLGQHGSQVGVGSLVAAVIWEFIFEKFDGNNIALPELALDAFYEGKIREHFAELDVDGALGGECWSDFSTKLTYWRENRAQIEGVMKDWDSHSKELKKLIKGSRQIALSLMAAGSPVEFKALTPAINSELARWSVSGAHLMRNRFVGIDLLEFYGLWNTQEINLIFERLANVIAKAGVGQ